MDGVSREDLLSAQKKSPKLKVHMTLQEKYDICCLADESPLPNCDFENRYTCI